MHGHWQDATIILWYLYVAAVAVAAGVAVAAASSHHNHAEQTYALYTAYTPFSSVACHSAMMDSERSHNNACNRGKLEHQEDGRLYVLAAAAVIIAAVA